VTAPPPERDSGTTLPSHLRQGELDRLAVLLRHATGGAWAVALYNTVAVRDDVMDTLRRRLSPLPVHDFTFTSERTNPLAYLEQLPKEGYEKRAIIFLYDLTRAGEQVWGFLEMQREALAEHPHGLVFWLTLEERGEAVRSAPNFWSQRSGVFDFTIADEATLAQVRGQWAGSAVRFADRADWERQVRLYQGLLEEYEQSEEAAADALFDLHGKIGRLHYAVSDYRRATQSAQRQLALAEKGHNEHWRAIALTNIGAAYDSLGKRRQALEYYEQALLIMREVGDRSGEATTLNNIGAVYDSLGERRRALEYYEQALPIRREVGDRSGEATTLNNIGLVYDNLTERRRALEYYKQALSISREVGDRSGEATTLNNIGLVYDSLGERRRPLEYYEQALPIRREVGDRAGEAATLNNIGAVYANLGERRRALEYYERALPIVREVGDRAVEAATLNNIGAVYDNLGERRRALEYYEQALSISREVGDRSGESVTLDNIAMVYEEDENYVEAIHLLEQVVAIDEAIEHPDLESDRVTLARLRKRATGRGLLTVLAKKAQRWFARLRG